MPNNHILTLSDLHTFAKRVEATIAAAERGEHLASTLAPLLRGATVATGATSLLQSGALSGYAPPRRIGRPPGSKNKATAAAPTAPTRTRQSRRGRRSADQVAQDDAALLEYIKAHPGERSQDIQKNLGLPKPNVASGLQRLRDGGSVKMKGTRAAATYSAG